MDNQPINSARDDGSGGTLRQQAEALGQDKTTPAPGSADPLSPDSLRATLHELHVHKIELELQNEELRRTQHELDAERARYFDLYDLAPVSYLTLNETGLIQAANLTTANLLGIRRSALANLPFSRFILKEDQDRYYLFRKNLQDSIAPKLCTIRMIKHDGSLFWAQLAMMVLPAASPAEASECRITLSDITEHKRNEAALGQKIDELERFNRLTVDREVRMIELKQEVNALLKTAGQPDKYTIAHE